MEKVKIENVDNLDFEWAISKKYYILLEETIVGEIVIWTFNKVSIVENIEDDYTFYIDEDTHMHEKTAEFILDNIENKNCVYIDSILIYDNYRRKGIGSKVLKIIKDMYKGSFIVLFASALDVKDKENHLLKNEIEFNRLLNKLDCFYKKAGFKNYQNIYYIK